MRKLYFKLAKTNILNNKPLYIPYLLSGIVTVAMLYMMLFLSGNKGISSLPSSESVQQILWLGVIVITIFSYIFIFYTNSFIVKRRKREVGIYNILGMEKKHISKILAIETLFSATVAIAGGLIVGIVFSRLMLMLLYRILNYKETIVFFVAYQHIIFTVVVFGVLYLFTLIFNTFQIRLAKPIELLRGSNVGEKEPKTKLIMAIIGLICIGVAYYIAITTEKPLEVISLFFIAVVLVIIGTYFLFIAGSIAMLKGMRKNKRLYYKKNNFTVISGMIYRMKQNAAGLASICILATMVLVMVSTTVSMYIGVDDELDCRFSSDIQVSAYNRHPSAKMGKIDTKLIDDIDNQIDAFGLKKTSYDRYTMFDLPMLREGSSFKTMEGLVDPETQEELEPTSAVTVMCRDSLIKLLSSENGGTDAKTSSIPDEVKSMNIPEIPSGKALVYGRGGYDLSTIELLNHKFEVIGTRDYTAKSDNVMLDSFDEWIYVIVDNIETERELYNEQKELCPDSFQFYKCVYAVNTDGKPEDKIACAEAIRYNVVRKDIKQYAAKYMECRAVMERDFFTIYGGLFFLGLFLSIMFIMITVLIIFYKQISEGYEDKKRFEIMQQVGMSNKEVKRTITQQVRVVFLLPIIAATIHVIAAFPMIRRLLSLMNLTNTTLFVCCLMVTVLVFTAIYYFVFKLTSRAYYKIVGNQV